MGQKLGKLNLIEDFKPLIKLSGTAVRAIFNALKALTDSTAFTEAELVTALEVIREELGLKDDLEIQKASCRYFKVMDPNKTGYVDIIEFISPLACMSTFEDESILHLIFEAMDFDQSGDLSVDEMVLGIKIAIKGFFKFVNQESPTTKELERIAMQGFLAADTNKDHVIDWEEFLSFCLTDPEISTWIQAFNLCDDPAQLFSESKTGVSPLAPHLKSEPADMTSKHLHSRGGRLIRKRWEASSVIFYNTVVVFGGRMENGSVSNELLLVDIGTGLCDRTVAEGFPPDPRAHHGACTATTKVLIKPPAETKDTSDTPLAATMRALSGHGPVAREITEQIVVIFGGLGEKGNLLRDTYILKRKTEQIAGNSASSKSDSGGAVLGSPLEWVGPLATFGGAPSPRQDPCLAEIRPGLVVVYGGLMLSDVHLLDIQDLEKPTWVEVKMVAGVAPEPATQPCISSRPELGVAYIFGGTIGQSATNKLYELEVNRLDEESYCADWSLVENEDTRLPSPEPRQGAVCTTIVKKNRRAQAVAVSIVVFGGSQRGKGTFLDGWQITKPWKTEKLSGKKQWEIVCDDVKARLGTQSSAGGTMGRAPACFDQMGRLIMLQNLDKANFMDSAVIIWPKLSEDFAAQDTKSEDEVLMPEKLVPVVPTFVGDKQRPPWYAGMIKPGSVPEFSSRAPDVRLALDWVWGFNCSSEIGNNLAYSSKTGELLYTTSSAVVLTKRLWEEETGVWEKKEVEQDPDDKKEGEEEEEEEEDEEKPVETEDVWRKLTPEEVENWGEEEHEPGEKVSTRKILRWKQRFMLEHAGELQAIAVDPKQLVCTTADSNLKIVVWETDTLKVRAVFQGFHSGRIVRLVFSSCGTRLLALSTTCGKPGANLSVYNWKESRTVYTKKIQDIEVHDARWIGSSSFVVVGQGPPVLWQQLKSARGAQLSDDLVFKSVKGIYGRSMGKAPSELVWVAPFPSSEQMLPEDPETSNADGKPGRAFFSERYVTATDSGRLYLWQGFNAVHSIRAHEGSITVLEAHQNSFLLVSGGVDGHVKLWSCELECISDIDASLHIPQVHSSLLGLGGGYGIHSATLNWSGTTVCLATRSGTVIEIDRKSGTMVDSTPIVQGEHRGNLCAVAVHPSNKELCTAGEGGVLRVWSMEEKCQLRYMALPGPAKVAVYNYSGHKLAVGLGGCAKDGKLHSSSGVLCIFKSKDLTLLQRFQDCRDAIMDIKWSEAGDRLALVSSDGYMMVYKTSDWSPRAKIHDPHTLCRNLDLSSDGAFLRAMTIDHQLRYFSVRRAALVPKEAVADVEWLTDSCPVGFNTQGLWPRKEKEVDPKNAVEIEEVKSNECASTSPLYLEEYFAVLKPDEDDEEPKPILLASGSVDGTIHLRSYPSLRLGSESTKVYRHTKAVARLAWTKSGDYLVTLGGFDRTAIRWKTQVLEELEGDEQPEEPPLEEEPTEEEKDGEENQDSKEDEEQVVKQNPKPYVKKRLRRPNADVAAGDAWERAKDIQALKAEERAAHTHVWLPHESKHQAAVTQLLGRRGQSVPAVEIELEWVYGHSSQLLRNAVFYNYRGQVVAPAGIQGVVMGAGRPPLPSRGPQRFFSGHTEEITAVCQHPERDFVASAQLGSPVRVHVWSSVSQQMIRSWTLPEESRAVSTMCFSWDGTLLAIAALNDAHSIYVYYWKDAVMKCSGSGGKQKILALAFTFEGTLLQAGINHFNVWNLSSISMTATKGGFNSEGTPQTVYCIGFIRPPPEGEEDEAPRDEEDEEGKTPRPAKVYDPVPVMGVRDGSLYRVTSRKVSGVSQAHSGPITCMWSHLGGLITGSKDGTVKLWSHALEEVASISLAEITASSEEEESDPPPGAADYARSVCLAQDGQTVLVATKYGALYELYPGTEGYELMGSTPLLDAPGSHDIACVVSDPHAQEFSTLGDDGKLRVWSAIHKKLMKMTDLKGCGKGLAFSADGSQLAAVVVKDIPLTDAEVPEKDQNEQESEEKEEETPPSGKGALIILRRRDLGIIQEISDLPALPTCVVYSPNTLFLGVGLSIGHVMIFRLREEIIQKIPKKIEEDLDNDEDMLPPPKHDPPIEPPEVKFEAEQKSVWQAFIGVAVEAMDFSADSSTVRIMGTDGKVQYFMAEKGEDAHHAKAIEWVSSNCWPDSEAEGLDHFAKAQLAAAPSACVDLAAISGRPALAVGNGYGEVGISRYPCIPGTLIASKFGHPSDQKVLVKFVSSSTHKNDPYLVSIGREDRCILQWKVKVTKEDPETQNTAPFSAHPQHHFSCSYTSDQNIIDFDQQGVHIFYKDLNDSRTLTSSGEVHAIAISPSKRYAALATSAPQQKCPSVSIWELNVPEKVCTLPNHQLAAVSMMCFSKESNYIAVITGADNLATIYFSASKSWMDASLIYSSPVSNSQLWFATWGPSPQDIFVFGGEQFIVFCGLQPGHRLSLRQGVFSSLSEPLELLCAAPAEGNLITGASSGELLMWRGNTIERLFTGHEGAVTAVDFYEPSGRFVTCSLDWSIKVWSPVFGLERNIALQGSLDTFIFDDSYIATCEFCNDKKALVKITDGKVFELSLTSGRCTKMLPFK